MIDFHAALVLIEEQKEIVRRIESVLALAESIEGNYKNLREKIDRLPQAILAKGFRGELVKLKPSRNFRNMHRISINARLQQNLNLQVEIT